MIINSTPFNSQKCLNLDTDGVNLTRSDKALRWWFTLTFFNSQDNWKEFLLLQITKTRLNRTWVKKNKKQKLSTIKVGQIQSLNIDTILTSFCLSFFPLSPLFVSDSCSFCYSQCFSLVCSSLSPLWHQIYIFRVLNLRGQLDSFLQSLCSTDRPWMAVLDSGAHLLRQLTMRKVTQLPMRGSTVSRLLSVGKPRWVAH